MAERRAAASGGLGALLEDAPVDTGGRGSDGGARCDGGGDCADGGWANGLDEGCTQCAWVAGDGGEASGASGGVVSVGDGFDGSDVDGDVGGDGGGGRGVGDGLGGAGGAAGGSW